MMNGNSISSIHHLEPPQAPITPMEAPLSADLAGGTPRTSTRKPLKLSESIVSGIVGVCDALCIAVVSVAFYVYFLGWQDLSFQPYLTEVAANIGLTLGIFHYVGLYNFNTIVAWPSRMRQMVVLSALVMLVLAALAVALKISEQFSRGWFFQLRLLGIGDLCLAGHSQGRDPTPRPRRQSRP